MPKYEIPIIKPPSISDVENDRNKQRCSQIAWGAVKKAGWSKGADGKWRK